MATASDNGTTVKEEKSSPPIEKMKTSTSGGQTTAKVETLSCTFLIRAHQRGTPRSYLVPRAIQSCDIPVLQCSLLYIYSYKFLMFHCSHYAQTTVWSSHWLVTLKLFLASSLAQMGSGLPAQQQIRRWKSGVHMMASLNVRSQATSRLVLIN